MKDAVSIKKDTNIKLESIMKSYLNPKYIFLPILPGFKLRVIDNSYVYKNDIVMISKNGKSVHSSISGRVLGVKEMLYANNKKISSLVIENDFKENIRVRKSSKKFIEHYDKKAFIELLEDTSLFYKGSYLIDKLNCDKKILLINGVELEPYFGNNYFLLNSNAESLLVTINLLSELFAYEKVVFAIKNNDSEIVNTFMNLIGTYPNIELRMVNDCYPNGNDVYLSRSLELNAPLILDLEEIINIYNVLKKQVPITEKLITITGNAVNPKCSIMVKVGSLLSEVFINNFDFTSECVDVYLNGMISGRKVDTLKYVIDSNIDGLVVMNKTDDEVSDCINCGLCSKNCPMNLNPKYVLDHDGKVKDDYKKGCLQCGLCSYMCPSKRNLKESMKGSEYDE